MLNILNLLHVRTRVLSSLWVEHFLHGRFRLETCVMLCVVATGSRVKHLSEYFIK
jgi:hypothetical protein